MILTANPTGYFSAGAETILAIVAGVFAVGWLISSFRRGKQMEVSSALRTALDEVSTYKLRADRLEQEVHGYREQVAGLEGKVQILTSQNAELRNLVMGDTVPPALLQTMNEIGDRVIRAIRQDGEVVA